LVFKTNNIASGEIDLNYKSTAWGHEALIFNSGSNNAALGFRALASNGNGSGNTGIGDSTLITNTTGTNITGLGYHADVNGSGYTNSTAIGYGATSTASNYLALGNTTVSVVAGQVNYSVYSDKRVKKDVQSDVPGLSFIKLLKPVTYQYDIDKENGIMGRTGIADNSGKATIEQMRFTGFLAQDVEAAANTVGYDFSGVVKPQNDKSLYGLRYAEFVVPLVKAVQEQQNTIDSMKNLIKDLQNCVNQMCPQATNCISLTTNSSPGNQGNGVVQNVTLSSLNAPILYQNTPNPFSSGTKISYFLPEGTMGAQMLFFDSYGKQLKSIDLNQTGNGTLNVTPDNLSAGVYSYSLVVNNKVVDTKRMLLQK
jgi:hypothetical protein